MKKYFILFLLIALYSCKDTDQEIGKGTDPELNISNHIFEKEGGTLEIHSQIGAPVMIMGDSIINGYRYPTSDDSGDLDAVWCKAEYIKRSTSVKITVKPNLTGEERIIPILFFSQNFQCKTKFTQK